MERTTQKAVVGALKDNQNTEPSKFFSAGSLDFCDGLKLDFNFLPNTIAVFDVAPFRLSVRALYNTSHELYSYENIHKFLTDVDECSKKLGFKVVFKSKELPRDYMTRDTRGF